MTQRQQDVYDLLMERIPISQIATTLNISRSRVYEVIKALKKKKLIKAKSRGIYKAI